MTPIDKAAIEGLIELASKLEKQLDDGDGAYPDDYHEVCHKAFDALPALQRLLSWETSRPAPETQAVAGSSVCPICGKDSPHYHGSEEQEARNSIVRAITDQHLLCIRLADALRGMPFPPHMPDEAGNAMRGALDEFDKKSAAYLQAALASPRSPVESVPREMTMADDVPKGYSPDGQYAWKAGWNACVGYITGKRELPQDDEPEATQEPTP